MPSLGYRSGSWELRYSRGSRGHSRPPAWDAAARPGAPADDSPATADTAPGATIARGATTTTTATTYR